MMARSLSISSCVLAALLLLVCVIIYYWLPLQGGSTFIAPYKGFLSTQRTETPLRGDGKDAIYLPLSTGVLKTPKIVNAPTNSQDEHADNPIERTQNDVVGASLATNVGRIQVATTDRNHRREKSAILVLSYMRAGSTLTGDLLNYNPEIFYLFEPVRFIHHQVHDGFMPANSTTRQLIELLDSIYRCDFNEFRDYVNYLTAPSKGTHLRYTVVATAALGCQPYTNLSSSSRLDACEMSRLTAANLTRLCEPRNVAVKVIRASLKDHIVPLSEILASRGIRLKVIHLIRDPRGVMSSRLSLHGEDRLSDGRLAESARDLCRQMVADLKDGRALLKPDQYHQVKYEDLAQYPIQTAKKVYSFLDLEMDAAVVKYLHIHAGAENSSNVHENFAFQYGTYRRNASATALGWRKGLTKAQIKKVEKGCREIFEMTDYKLFD
ncbi:PREDICTED: carbohydrate sulfotransferase 1-like [Priapulus caudatus]|uniref:Carbohydrate sulfotransferase 1-like n=1 Tax=Priapulus caudatus TaxID=37621 RepID=A0ABM1F9U2_PRICU|nr:PREDICTED: carbohydrate sulfotransferase 1-like [Priapulus caudatus]